MPDEKHLYDAILDPPIPTYEEATSSQPSSRFGPQEVSDDAERQGLLGNDLAPASSNSRRRNGYYHPPSVQSVPESDDEQSELGSPVDEGEDAALRQTMEEMDILDPETAEDGRARRNRARGAFSKRFYRITHSLSSLHLPRLRWPALGSLFSKLPTIPDEYKPGWSIIARLFGLFLIVSLVYFLVVSEVIPMSGNGYGQPFNPEWVRQVVQKNVESWRIEEDLKYITSYDHVGGSEGSFFMGQWIEGRFKESRMDTFTHDDYFVYLNYPKKGGRRVAIVDPPELKWEARLEEENAYNPPKDQTAAFHGLSASGNVTGPLIYANYGSKKDFKTLDDSAIDVRGAIVLVRYYGTQSDRAMKVKAAQEAGAAGVLIYSDPADDGYKKGAVWPAGRWRPEDSIQRGSVAITSWIAGDVLTPGRASTKDAKRLPKDKNPALPHIPSLPLASRDAKKLLQALKGKGQKVFPEWVGAVPEVDEWWSGSLDQSPQVNLQNLQDEVDKQRVRNIFGSFIGMEDKAKKIVVGNHRDSWCFGAADPGSGTAIMLEVARLLGQLRSQGWRPLRTIEFASWDAEEYNLIGSTEHVEANIDDLRANAIAYINVDVGVTGDKLWANGSPLLRNAWHRAIGRVVDPNTNTTLKELWESSDSQLGSLGAGSDYLAWQDLAGCSSLDFGFSGPEHGDMYHSCYETFDWVSKYVDPGFAYHNVLAQLWALIILELAQEPIIPMRINDYADTLTAEVQDLISWTETKGSNFDIGMFEGLVTAVGDINDEAKMFHGWETYWYNQITSTGGMESPGLTMQRISFNNRMAGFETALLDLPKGKNDKEAHGIPGRTQYKHVIYGPDASGSGYDAAVFPFVRDAVEKGDWDLAARQLNMTAAVLRGAIKSLRD